MEPGPELPTFNVPEFVFEPENSQEAENASDAPVEELHGSQTGHPTTADQSSSEDLDAPVEQTMPFIVDSPIDTVVRATAAPVLEQSTAPAGESSVASADTATDSSSAAPPVGPPDDDVFGSGLEDEDEVQPGKPVLAAESTSASVSDAGTDGGSEPAADAPAEGSPEKKGRRPNRRRRSRRGQKKIDGSDSKKES